MKRSILLNGTLVEYELTYKKVKNINLRIRPDETVSLSAPFGTPEDRIEGFLLSVSDKILKALQRYREASRENDSGYLYILGTPYKVRTIYGDRPSVRVNDTERTVTVIVRPGATEESAESLIFGEFGRMCASEVRKICIDYYPAFRKICPTYPSITFRKMRSQWGNCRPAKNRLTFNTRLIQLPGECIELVVVHEFTHFSHPDHSKRFYEDLAKILPDWKERKRKLDEYSAHVK